jgi:transcriptional regulator of arginine metabolism
MPAENDQREPRREAIVALVRRHRIANQADLARRLKQRGFAVTQSSVSRDLRDLGVAKVSGRYVVPETAPAAPSDGLQPVAPFLKRVSPAGPHLTVVRTSAGAAQSVGLALDNAGWPEIVGTVAGDDTVFVATGGAREQRQFVRRVERVMQEGAKG